MIKLSQEEKERLREFSESNQCQLVLKWCDVMIARMERNVINCPITSGSREITLKKAKLDGAVALRVAIDSIKAGLKDV